MNIGILTSADPQLRQQLAPNESQANPEAQPEPVATAPKPRPTHNTAPSTRFPSLRAALDARVAADVSSGQLSAADAVTIGKTLDAIENGSDESAGSVSTTALLAGRPRHGAADADTAQAARNYLGTIDRGTLIDRWA